MTTQDSRLRPPGIVAGAVPLRVLVVTVVHDPDDARIRFRQLGSLLAAGVAVTYAAPFTAYGRVPPPGVEAVDLPRAAGRDRASAVLAARRLVHRAGPEHDVVLLHDPELLAVVPGLGDHPLTIWDVHEDTAAAVGMKRWVPGPLRPVAAFAVRHAERWAERRCELLLAEEGYRGRFRRPHPVVPNSAMLPAAPPPPAGRDRVVYLGRLTAPRGTVEMLELGRRLAASSVRLELIGPTDPDVAGAVAEAVDRGWVTHHGFVPNSTALSLLRGALAGLALLHDEPNYAASRPTKVMEYMGFGVPVVTTPNAASAELVRRYGSGLVVPFGDVGSAARAVLSLRDDESLRLRLGASGRAAALRDLDWRADGDRFATLLKAWAAATHA
jgi:glycosyltransferase involved in cell wall biosynthesis